MILLQIMAIPFRMCVSEMNRDKEIKPKTAFQLSENGQQNVQQT